MTKTTEIAPDLFKISTFLPDANLEFNQFLIRDEQPLLYHTGMKGLFPLVLESVSKIIDPSSLKWIGFSHFEADECGSLREWQQQASDATAVCSFVAKMISVDDMAAERPARPLQDGEELVTGKYRFEFLQTPNVPHAWDAGLLFEKTTGTLLSSDLFHQNGEVEPITSSDVVGRFKEAIAGYEQSPFAGYLPLTPKTEEILNRLADLNPETIAPMHGSAFNGDCKAAIKDLAVAMREVYG
jgi:flavorubredoxin